MPIEDINSLIVYGPGNNILPYKGLVAVKISLKEIVNELIEVSLLLVSDRIQQKYTFAAWYKCHEILCIVQSCSSLDRISRPWKLALQPLHVPASNVQLGLVQSTKVISIPPGETVPINALNPESVTAIFESGNTCLPGSLFVVPEVLELLASVGRTARVKIHVQNYLTRTVHIQLNVCWVSCME